MTKTVKELCTTDISKDEVGNFPESMYELSLIFDKRINDILQAYEKDIKIYAGIIQKLGYEHKKEIAEKNEYINFLENRPGNHDCKNCPNRNNELEQKLLIVDLIKTYKYEIIKYQHSQYNDNKTIEIGMLKFVIKDLEKLFGIQNHKLPSKEDKTCI